MNKKTSVIILAVALIATLGGAAAYQTLYVMRNSNATINNSNATATPTPNTNTSNSNSSQTVTPTSTPTPTPTLTPTPATTQTPLYPNPQFIVQPGNYSIDPYTGTIIYNVTMNETFTPYEQVSFIITADSSLAYGGYGFLDSSNLLTEIAEGGMNLQAYGFQSGCSGENVGAPPAVITLYYGNTNNGYSIDQVATAIQQALTYGYMYG